MTASARRFDDTPVHNPGRITGIAYSRIRSEGRTGVWVVLVAYRDEQGMVSVNYHFAARELAAARENGAPSALGLMISRIGPICLPVPGRRFVSYVGDAEERVIIRQQAERDGHVWEVEVDDEA